MNLKLNVKKNVTKDLEHLWILLQNKQEEFAKRNFSSQRYNDKIHKLDMEETFFEVENTDYLVLDEIK